MACGQALVPSPPNEARNSKIAQRNRAQSCCPDNDRSVPTQAAAEMRGSGASDNMWGSVNHRRRQAGVKGCKKEEKALVGLVLEFYSTNGLVSTLLINASEFG